LGLSAERRLVTLAAVIISDLRNWNTFLIDLVFVTVIAQTMLNRKNVSIRKINIKISFKYFLSLCCFTFLLPPEMYPELSALSEELTL
jgi:hypothetical protein